MLRAHRRRGGAVMGAQAHQLRRSKRSALPTAHWLGNWLWSEVGTGLWSPGGLAGP